MSFSIAESCWQTAWQNKSFRIKALIGTILLLIILVCFPIFFNHIQYRQGILLNDWLLSILPAHNMSVMIFICIWSTTLLALIRSVQNPDFFLTTLYSYCLLSIFRFITITIVALDPPVDLIPLADPLSNFFYGKSFITKDLFFSGHTSTLFLISLCLHQKKDKYFALITSIMVGILVLIQHVHYTIDVITSPFFALIAYKMGKKLAFF
jgi:hypothetical protein